jgi:hypothetical protein
MLLVDLRGSLPVCTAPPPLGRAGLWASPNFCFSQRLPSHLRTVIRSTPSELAMVVSNVPL